MQVTAGGEFQPMPLPVATMFSRTKYFEIDSAKAGARYGVWVTVPSSYEPNPKQRFPAIYAPDGNRAMTFAPFIGNAGLFDPINPVQSSIQISVGYTGEDVKYALAVRARDLVPPNEPPAVGAIESMRNAPPNNLLDRRGMDLYIHNLENPAADRFLAFLTEELHPFVTKNYRIDPEQVGLFGHSFGGLFATYAALQKSTIFRNICASSPGIKPGDSRVFQLYDEAVASGGLSERNLHMAVGTREITEPTTYQAIVGSGTVEFMTKVGTKPLKGLKFSTHMIPHESHMSAEWPAFYSFLREHYPAKDAGSRR